MLGEGGGGREQWTKKKWREGEIVISFVAGCGAKKKDTPELVVWGLFTGTLPE